MSNNEINSELALLKLLQQDDLVAFDELYWKYQKAVFQNVFKLTHDTIIAEDIVQEVFIGLWEKRQSIDIERSVGGWLFVSSYNRAINMMKKQHRQMLLMKELEKQNSQNESVPDVYDIQVDILEKAMAELSPQKRRVFELCKIQGKTYEETAVILEISKHTVKEYLSDAVKLIKEYASKNPGIGLLFLLLNTGV